MQIILGTRNKNKVKEVKAIFENIVPNVQIISLDEIDPNRLIEEPIEDGQSFYENSLIKAKYYFEKTQLPTICDDSGIVVDALGGKPGIYSARFSLGTKYELPNVDKSNNIMLLDLMINEDNRNGHYACEMVFYDGINIISGYGELNGTVLYEEQGDGGFGYDPLFYIPEYECSLGELDASIKNKISHRFNAIKNIADKLAKYLKK